MSNKTGGGNNFEDSVKWQGERGGGGGGGGGGGNKMEHEFLKAVITLEIKINSLFSDFIKLLCVWNNNLEHKNCNPQDRTVGDMFFL